MDDHEAILWMKNGQIDGLEVLVNRYQIGAVQAAVLQINRTVEDWSR